MFPPILLLSVVHLVFCDAYLENWMGQMLPIIGQKTLLDISLPGTHDSTTYDLDTIVSEGGDDGSAFLSTILHYASELGIAPGDWIRNQSKTQGLDVTGQLNNGIRFIDFRTMYTSGDWYCLHFMQSKHTSLTYLTEIKNWLVAHPNEIIVIWLSKHGSECAVGDNQFPGVSIATKRAFWSKITELFAGLILDTRISSTNTTTINELIKRNHRVVFYAADYAQFTANSSLAYDSCQNLDNPLNCDVIGDWPQAVKTYKQMNVSRSDDKAANRFLLLSMAKSESGEIIEFAFFLRYLDVAPDYFTKRCSEAFGVPNMSKWCPDHLQLASQLNNYYNQVLFEHVLTCDYQFPHAIYIDAVDAHGTIRTGTENFFPTAKRQHFTTAYSYVYTILWATAKRLCTQSGACSTIKAYLQKERDLYPLVRWEDQFYGRHTNWPVIPTTC